MRGWIILLAALPLGPVGVSRADDSNRVNTWMRLDGFTSTRALDNDTGDGSILLGLKNSYSLGASDALKVEGGVLVGMRGNHGEVRLPEAVWQHRWSWLDLRVGQQRITWGKADGINPTDFFTPHDYTVLLPMEADQRLSVPAVRADAALSESLTLSLVTQPIFIDSKLPSLPGMSIGTRNPGDFAPQVGVRLASAGDSLDWSVSAFHGYLKQPLLDGTFMTGATEPTLFWQYPRLDAVGADIAHNFGKFGFRAEVAWLEPSSEDGRSRIHRHGFLVTGVDRGGENWNVNAQAIARFTPRVADIRTTDPLAAMVDTENAINYGQLHRTQFGLTSRLAHSWMDQALQTEVLVVGYFQPSTFLIRPLVGYALNDTQRLTIGGEYYTGSNASYFGQFKNNRTGFVEYQQFF